MGRAKELLKTHASSENTVSSANFSLNDAEPNDSNHGENRSPLVSIVKEGLVQPAPLLSRQSLNQSFKDKFTLQTSRDLDYREFSFLNGPDRKANESLLEDVRPSKQASIPMKLLKSSMPRFGKATPAVLVIIEEPRKSLRRGTSIAKDTSDSGSKAKNSPDTIDEDYLQELTTYRAISIHPLIDV